MALDQIDVDELDEKEGSGEAEMSFFDHLDVLRWHIIRSVLVWFSLAVTCFLAKDFVFGTIINGPRNEDFLTYRILCSLSESMCIKPTAFKLRTQEMGETFFTHMSVSFWMALIIAVPYILWEVWRFIKPGLYIKEQNNLNLFIVICSGLFFMGVMFGYFIVAPLAVNFLAAYDLPGVENTPTLGSYIDYLIMFTLPLGLVFELPVVAYFLGKLGIVSSKMLSDYRRLAIVILLVFAGFITPSPDILSQMLVFAPLFILYETSIYVVKRIEKQNRALEAI